MGSITLLEGRPPEQVLIGKHKNMQLIVLSVKPDEESAQTCWEAACNIIDVLQLEGSPAIIIDIATASVRHGYLTEMSKV